LDNFSELGFLKQFNVLRYNVTALGFSLFHSNGKAYEAPIFLSWFLGRKDVTGGAVILQLLSAVRYMEEP
jgi:hypothetical protein